MEQTLIASGIACIVAAIVGGGLKAFKIEIPVLKSVARQVSLGVFGLLLIGAAFVVNQDPQTTTRPDPNNDSGQMQAGTSASSSEDTGNDESSDAPNQPTQPAEEQPPSDFPDGSSRVYVANFNNWDRPNTEHGNVSLGFGDVLVLEPSSNTWIWASTEQISGIDGDFVCDLDFRVEERHPDASIQLGLEGTGQKAEVLDLHFSVRDDGELDYYMKKGFTIYKEGEVPRGVDEEKVTGPDPPPAVQNHDWSTGSELTLKRTGGRMQFFINDQFITEFGTSVYPIREASILAAQRSKIVITSLEFRKPI